MSNRKKYALFGGGGVLLAGLVVGGIVLYDYLTGQSAIAAALRNAQHPTSLQTTNPPPSTSLESPAQTTAFFAPGFVQLQPETAINPATGLDYAGNLPYDAPPQSIPTGIN